MMNDVTMSSKEATNVGVILFHEFDNTKCVSIQAVGLFRTFTDKVTYLSYQLSLLCLDTYEKGCGVRRAWHNQ